MDPRTEARLLDDEVVWLTTVRGDGQPQTTPVWFLWEDGGMLIYSRPGKPKLRNIEENDAVVLALRMDERGDDVVVIEGRAARDRHAPPADRHPAYLEKYRDPIARIGYDPAGFAADYSDAFRVTPTRVRAW